MKVSVYETLINLHWQWSNSRRLNFLGGKFRRISKFCDNSVAENNPTFAYIIIIFIDRTSTYTITFMHRREGRLGSELGLV